MSDAPSSAVELTRAWIEQFVIGLGLCPFAAAPFNRGRVHVEACDSDRADDVYRAFLDLVYRLLTCEPDSMETALLVVPNTLQGFDDYLDTLESLQQALAEAGAEGMVQIASFHPQYCFDGEPADDPANYSNRSPYPMFHLLREDGLAAALESWDDPDQIPLRNIARLRQLGIDRIRDLLARIGVNVG